jgi:glycine/D-amino acid oxidase-like deaminating enzyme
MSCVVIGAGLAGLSSAYFLQKKGVKVTVFHTIEKKATSAIFVGILYQYPGRWGKKSDFAKEGYSASKELILEVERQTGRKVILSSGVIKKFATRLKKYPDVTMHNGDAHIDDGLTIDMREYLAGLKELIGLENIIERRIDNLSEIDGKLIIAAGYGGKDLFTLEGLKYLKGQQYVGVKNVGDFSHGSVVSRGHISYMGGDKVCLGSTYEAIFDNDEVDERVALSEIGKKIEPWYGSLEDVKERRFASGIRVGQGTSYLPLIKQVDENTFIFTALGSRGLLYHAYYGKILADQIN